VTETFWLYELQNGETQIKHPAASYGA